MNFDIQAQFDAFWFAQKAERMKTSQQLTLGEFVLLLKGVKDKGKKLIFDDPKFMPTNFDSWRGDYADLMLDYDLSDKGRLKTVEKWIEISESTIGETFDGYKGGEYVMGKNTPIWVATYGSSIGFKQDEENELYYQAVVGIEETPDCVVIKTAPMDF